MPWFSTEVVLSTMAGLRLLLKLPEKAGFYFKMVHPIMSLLVKTVEDSVEIQKQFKQERDLKGDRE